MEKQLPHADSTYLGHAMSNAVRKTSILGIIAHDVDGKIGKVSNTALGAIVLCQMLAEAVQNVSQNLVLEISSHARELKRTYRREIDFPIFANLSPEHLDFHGNFDDYFSAKKCSTMSMAVN
jgi:UDP-N-acetylmuramoyl-L-alanyl-D-glutamate--2,6-diaminopimelate ligase